MSDTDRSNSDRFTDAERRALELALRAGAALHCPHCHNPLDRRSVPPRSDVSYVRDRVWVSCPTCRRTVVLDRKQPR